MTRALFICGKARHRRPTAAELASIWPTVEVDFAGLSNDADEPLTREQLHWADMIFVMETRQKKRLTTRFGSPRPGVKIISLDIPDRFTFMEDALVALLLDRLTHHFGPRP